MNKNALQYIVTMNNKRRMFDFLIGFTLLTSLCSCMPFCGDTIFSRSFMLMDYPSAPNYCVYWIRPSNHRVRQIKIEFTIRLAQPIFYKTEHTSLPSCERDYVDIEDMIFCGNERNQHVYVPFPNKLASFISISIQTAKRFKQRNKYGSYWQFNVTQVELDSSGSYSYPPPAPPGCLQYFTGYAGEIKSFNYRGRPASYPAELKYKICIRRPQNVVGLRLRFYDFDLRGDFATGEGQISNFAFCKTEFMSDNLLIPQSAAHPTGITDLRDNKFCGKSLDGKVVLVSGMNFEADYFWMVFEPRWYIEQNSTGFRINYQLFVSKH